MKFYFENAQEISDAISLVEKDLGFSQASSITDADLTVRVSKTDSSTVGVKLSEKEAIITYGGGTARFLRGLARLVGWIKEGKSEGEITENPIFRTNGAMVDMSRDAVMNVETVKFMLRKMALMGMNTFMLYTEDTYEITERPYFGYMRGRYTKDELRELDRYALTLGIELIPCIQVLGHLATMLRWAAHSKVKDSQNVMLVGEEETYRYIEDMFRTTAECFTTKRLHMGMDETHDLGRGKYLDRFGYRNIEQIYSEHLYKVTEMAKSFGFKPMIWSDMLFREPSKLYDPNMQISAERVKLVPSDCSLVFWDYYHASEEFYAKNIVNHKKISQNVMFAGGVWTWSGHCPLFSLSIAYTRPALQACKKENLDEVVATVWHNGAECSLLSSLAGLAWYANFDYIGKWDEKSIAECFKYATGESYDTFLALELPEHSHSERSYVSRALLYNDPLVGLIDKHIELSGKDFREYYLNVTENISKLKTENKDYSSMFKVIEKLSALLEYKADFGVRLKKAYDKKNTVELERIASECDVIIERIKELCSAHKNSWMQYNKPFGWEVHDIRYGGLAYRFETAKERINDYLNGKIEKIEELEAKRLRYDDRSEEDEAFIEGGVPWWLYTSIATASIL